MARPAWSGRGTPVVIQAPLAGPSLTLPTAQRYSRISPPGVDGDLERDLLILHSDTLDVVRDVVDQWPIGGVWIIRSNRGKGPVTRLLLGWASIHV